jgi:hypothetical protein
MIRLTVRHVYDFGADRELVGDDLVRPEAWDALRVQTDGPFSMARDRAELEHVRDEHPEIGERVRVVDRLLRDRGASSLASYGVGGGVPEVWLQEIAPETRLTLAEYAPETLDRLRELFPGVDVQQHDLLRDPPLAADVHLFHRIDTELDDAQWHEVFRRFAGQVVIVVATEVADLKRIALEVRSRVQNRHASRAGWMRNRGAFEALFKPTHDATPVTFNDLDGWLLEPRS